MSPGSSPAGPSSDSTSSFSPSSWCQPSTWGGYMGRWASKMMRTGPQGPLLPCRLQQVGSTAWGASTSPSPPTAMEPGDHGNLRPKDKTGGKRMGRSFVKMSKPCQPLQNCQKNSNLMKKQSNYSSVQWEGACHSTEHKWNFKERKRHCTALTRGPSFRSITHGTQEITLMGSLVPGSSPRTCSSLRPSPARLQPQLH